MSKKSRPIVVESPYDRLKRWEYNGIDQIVMFLVIVGVIALVGLLSAIF